MNGDKFLPPSAGVYVPGTQNASLPQRCWECGSEIGPCPPDTGVLIGIIIGVWLGVAGALLMIWMIGGV